MFERFTTTARDTVVRAQREARELSDRAIGTEHLLLALLDPPAPLASRVLGALGVSADAVRAALRPGAARLVSDADAEALGSLGIDVAAVLARLVETYGEQVVRDARGHRDKARSGRRHVPFTPSARDVLEFALREAVRRGDRRLDDGHILAGLLEAGGPAIGLLGAQGVRPHQVRAELERARRRSA